MKKITQNKAKEIAKAICGTAKGLQKDQFEGSYVIVIGNIIIYFSYDSDYDAVRARLQFEDHSITNFYNLDNLKMDYNATDRWEAFLRQEQKNKCY